MWLFAMFIEKGIEQWYLSATKKEIRSNVINDSIVKSGKQLGPEWEAVAASPSDLVGLAQQSLKEWIWMAQMFLHSRGGLVNTRP